MVDRDVFLNCQYLYPAIQRLIIIYDKYEGNIKDVPLSDPNMDHLQACRDNIEAAHLIKGSDTLAQDIEKLRALMQEITHG